MLSYFSIKHVRKKIYVYDHARVFKDALNLHDILCVSKIYNNFFSF